MDRKPWLLIQKQALNCNWLTLVPGREMLIYKGAALMGELGEWIDQDETHLETELTSSLGLARSCLSLSH